MTADAIEEGTLEIGASNAGWCVFGSQDSPITTVLAHGAGAPYQSSFMTRTAQALAAREQRIVLFNFPYMETQQRSGKRRPPSHRTKLLEAWQAILDHVVTRRGCGPLLIGGKSMGGRMASMLLARGPIDGVVGAVYLGYPLHPAGKKDRLRADHLPAVPVPQLFVSGDKDALCDLDLLRPIIDDIPSAELHVVTGGDHSLVTHRQRPFEAMDDWVDRLERFRAAIA